MVEQKCENPKPRREGYIAASAFFVGVAVILTAWQWFGPPIPVGWVNSCEFTVKLERVEFFAALFGMLFALINLVKRRKVIFFSLTLIAISLCIVALEMFFPSL